MTRLREAFEIQSRACADLGSPFMARLMALAAERLEPGGVVADRLFAWPGDVRPRGQAIPLRFAGALHALKLEDRGGLAAVYPPHDGEVDDDRLWSRVREAMETEADFLMARLDRTPQTNEVRRMATMIPALNMVAARWGLPLDLIEVGCSAGLNLRADRFRLVAGDVSYGPETSPLVLTPDWEGTAPAPADVRVTGRTGIDIAPLDPEADRLRLLSYLWPDQPERIRLSEAAMDLARAHPAEIVAADAADWLEANLAPREGVVTMLYHTIAWQYLPDDAKERGEAAVARAARAATATGPLARFGMETGTGGAALTLRLWPGDVTLELGLADYHGRWVRWYGSET